MSDETETKRVSLDKLRAELERVRREHPDLRRDVGRTIAAIDRKKGKA